MIFITDRMHTDMVNGLFEKLQDVTCFYNGKIEFVWDEFHAHLTCSLILYPPESPEKIHKTKRIGRIVPVWWDFRISEKGIPRAHDFSWSDFSSFFPCHA